MNPLKHFETLVAQSMASSGASHARATHLVSDGHPDLVTLARAYGATGQCVQFMNSRWEAQAKAPALSRHNDLVNARMASAQCNRAAAEGWVQLYHADVVATVTAQSKKPTFANDGSGAPIGGPQVWATLRLPIGSSQEEVNICYEANGNTLAQLQPGRAFAGLIDFIQKRDSLDTAAALAKAKTTYPKLWELCQQVAAQPV